MRRMLQLTTMLLLSLAIFACSKQEPAKSLTSAESKNMLAQMQAITAANFSVDVAFDLSNIKEELRSSIPTNKVTASMVGAYDLEHKYEHSISLKTTIENLGEIAFNLPMVVDFKQLDLLVNPTDLLESLPLPIPLGAEFDQYRNKYIRVDLSKVLEKLNEEADIELDKLPFDKIAQVFMRVNASTMQSLDDKLFTSQKFDAVAKRLGASQQIGLTLDAENYSNYIKLFNAELGKEIKQPELALPKQILELYDSFMVEMDKELTNNDNTGEFVFYFDQQGQLLASATKYNQTRADIGSLVVDVVTEYSNIGQPKFKINPAAAEIVDFDLPL